MKRKITLVLIKAPKNKWKVAKMWLEEERARAHFIFVDIWEAPARCAALRGFQASYELVRLQSG